MGFNEIDLARYNKELGAYIEGKRPPAHVRKEVDVGFRIHGQSIEVFEIRPRWNNVQEIVESPVAKATYVKTQGIWKIYWQRADLKWHAYKPKPVATSLKEFLAVLEADEFGCFWG
ncbi:DUF3024 domain-containing protein [Aliidiomarina quisquiliarum]|uniref:DUF3024 domain-containing protein n=1 Tax=Aliidiomarina quisquiliarum TaxID=2938947 RepID=UPI00208F9948|nr:DUF3024 domain-containing protein [Aliidiomarina quisquiliarum]MCO4320707.1 DUF3024 domain-containing protein [Aliidiomarina quisquiliarum]